MALGDFFQDSPNRQEVGAIRIAAISRGENHYFTGIPCINGHVSKRYVSTRQCFECRSAESRRPQRAEYHRLIGREAYIKNKTQEPWVNAIKNAKARSKKNGFDFNLTVEWAKERWTGNCEFSGLPFDLSYTGVKGCRPFSASIDKKDPSKGYTQDNCWIILFAYNAAKGAGTMEDLQRLFGSFKGELS